MKTTVILLVFFTIFSLNTFAQEFPYTSLEGHTDHIFSVVFSPDGQTLASRAYPEVRGSRSWAGRLWEVQTGTLLHTITEFHGISFSLDWQMVVSGSENGTIYLM
ncbi:MAG: hypothetical protein OXU27_01160 [Candidatus Poribacteria bacterium]|nr:hypothetical protein [Candidatus Poribacteria bacterium]